MPQTHLTELLPLSYMVYATCVRAFCVRVARPLFADPVERIGNICVYVELWGLFDGGGLYKNVHAQITNVRGSTD